MSNKVSKFLKYTAVLTVLSLFLLAFPKTTLAGIYNCDCGPCGVPECPGGTCCVWCEPGPTDCNMGCTCCSSCGGGGACFTGDTKIATPGGEKEIKDTKEGDVVKSFDAETGEIREATVSAVHKRQVQGYYILKTESGKQIKVTGEHPILAVKQESANENEKSKTERKVQILSSSVVDLVKRIFRRFGIKKSEGFLLNF